MPRQYARPVHPLAEKVKHLTGVEKAEARSELAKVKPGIAAALRVKASFSASYHRKLLELDDQFLSNANRTSQKILELGAGNGRLAATLARNSNVHYTIFDRSYSTDIEQFPLNRTVRRLARKGAVKVMVGNFYEHDFGNETWHHILLPASFFPRAENSPWEQTDLDRTELVKKLLEHVKIGGTIRASHLVIPLEQHAKLHSFLRRERNAGKLEFRTTQIDFPPQVAKKFGPGTFKGLIITRLK